MGRRIFLLALHRTHGRIGGTREVVIASLPYLVVYREKRPQWRGADFSRGTGLAVVGERRGPTQCKKRIG